jgi:hypothetical protein
VQNFWNQVVRPSLSVIPYQVAPWSYANPSLLSVRWEGLAYLNARTVSKYVSVILGHFETDILNSRAIRRKSPFRCEAWLGEQPREAAMAIRRIAKVRQRTVHCSMWRRHYVPTVAVASIRLCVTDSSISVPNCRTRIFCGRSLQPALIFCFRITRLRNLTEFVNKSLLPDSVSYHKINFWSNVALQNKTKHSVVS